MSKDTPSVRPCLGAFASRPCPPGSRIAYEYTRKVNKDGSVVRVVLAKYDHYAQIQASRKSCEYAEMIEAFFSGDADSAAALDAVLIENAARYTDVCDSIVPDLRTVLNSQVVARSFFEEKGGEDYFKMSFEQFLRSYEVADHVPEPENPAGGEPNAET